MLRSYRLDTTTSSEAYIVSSKYDGVCRFGHPACCTLGRVSNVHSLRPPFLENGLWSYPMRLDRNTHRHVTSVSVKSAHTAPSRSRDESATVLRRCHTLGHPAMQQAYEVIRLALALWAHGSIKYYISSLKGCLLHPWLAGPTRPVAATDMVRLREFR